MQYQKAKQFIFEALELGIPANMHYHNRNHTESVLRAVDEISVNEGVDGDDLILVRTAALFHDSGFLKGYDDHESQSCSIANNVLPELGYSYHQIDHICRMIMATKLPQQPTCNLSRILADADLWHLGTGDAYAVADLLYREFEGRGLSRSPEEWLEIQIMFVESHEYWTEYAYRKNEECKQAYLSQLLMEKSFQGFRTVVGLTGNSGNFRYRKGV